MVAGVELRGLLIGLPPANLLNLSLSGSNSRGISELLRSVPLRSVFMEEGGGNAGHSSALHGRRWCQGHRRLALLGALLAGLAHRCKKRK